MTAWLYKCVCYKVDVCSADGLAIANRLETLHLSMSYESNKISPPWCCKGCYSWNAWTGSCTAGASLSKPEPPVNHSWLPGGLAQQKGGLFVPAAAATPGRGSLNQWKHSALMTPENKSRQIMSLFQMMHQKQCWHFLLKKFSQHLGVVTIFLSTFLILI